MSTVNKKGLIRTSLIASGLLFSLSILNGCVEDAIPEIKEAEESTKTEKKEDEISEEQKKLMEEMETVKPEDAVENIEDNVNVEELEKIEIEKKDKYTDINEFSAFISEVFFNYHSGAIDSEELLELITPHLHEYFIEQLPEDEDARIDMFSTIQQLFTDNLNSKLKSYVTTTSEKNDIADEAVFFRKYTLEDNSSIYYETTVKLENGQWLLVDDVPTVSYEDESEEN
ncbi:hypothetical protein ACOQFO_16645 [Ureibacillus sp. MALMAid1270]|uniref:hypothetical protein n=1 Tax=Ureibacillus sp. MALMAid1270 TaxID=3411629 RepID=UPI003BA4307A